LDGEQHLCSFIFVFLFSFQFHMLWILFSDYYRRNIVTYMDFEIHFSWVLLIDFCSLLVLQILNIWRIICWTIELKNKTMPKDEYLPFGDHPWEWIWGREFKIAWIVFVFGYFCYKHRKVLCEDFYFIWFYKFRIG
jgi:hypothetical protein